MRYVHQIEVAEGSSWQVIAEGDGPEEHDGTAADYGRCVLQQWIDDQSSLIDAGGLSYGEDGYTDQDGNPLIQARVAFAEDPFPFDGPDGHVVAVDCTQLDDPSPEIAALEAARERKLYAKMLDSLASDELEEALQAAHAVGGRSANWFAEFVYPAISRPVALRAMR
ncbi:hypothetical protein ACIPPN_30850 [Streptomyces diastaticus]|uniref:hypothetical protein n=1 Tax=Streptomyces diastaticus TaxID=1956 RepID=UPI00380F2918